MNKAAIEKFAVWARQKLISDITYKAGLLGISEKGIAQPLPQSTTDLQLFDIGTKNFAEVSGNEIEQRDALVSVIKAKERTSNFKTAFEAVIEEVAYTWFNRLVAIRFMEVNNYLPSRVRVLSSINSAKTEPDFVTTPFDTDLVFSEKEESLILELKDNNKLDELFRMLFIKQCNKLNEVLPELFEKTEDYTELLLNISFTDKDGVVYHLTHDIAEENFDVEKEGQVEIIGWMYQYYNSELKADTFAKLKKNVKISKERIPSATQLFTPDWIVRYMVENSLGRLWIEGHPNDNLKSEWKYYLEEAEQEPSVRGELEKLKTENLKPNTIKIIDPCMGSGHILVYAFDVLMQIYEVYGYTQRDAAKSIIENNLYGLDIDKRAYQLAYFAVMMKARQYNRKILNGEINLNLCAIEESNTFNNEYIELFKENRANAERLVELFKNAKTYGSIINVDLTLDELNSLKDEYETICQNIYDSMFDSIKQAGLKTLFAPMLKQAFILAQKYEDVVTNPPYMGSSGMAPKLSEFVKKHYPDSKSDLFAVFIEKGNHMIKPNGYNSMVTMQSWMFLSSFEKMRIKMLTSRTITNLMHMENMVMGIAFGTAVTIFKNARVDNYKGTYNLIKLQDINNGEPKEFPVMENRFAQVSTDNFSKIPGSPIAYWVSDNFIKAFEKGVLLGNIANSKQGIATADNNRFLRLWTEISIDNASFNTKSHKESESSSKKWYPYNKGGEFRKWYGNNDYVVNWFHDGMELKSFKKSVLRNPSYYFKECFSWSLVSSSVAAFRYKPIGHIFDVAGMSCFSEDKLKYLLALCNSNCVMNILQVIAPTINYQCGDIANIPVILDENQKPKVDAVVDDNIVKSKSDWDSFETSWDFTVHPLVGEQFSVHGFQFSETLSNQTTENSKLKTENSTRSLEFAVFCVESIAQKLETDGAEIYELLTEKSDILNSYIIPNYEMLHTQSKEYIVEDITTVMKEQGVIV